MKKVNVNVFDGDGEPLTATDSEVKALWPSMPIEHLHTGQSLYLTLNLSQGTPPTRSAEIQWKDGRVRRQSRQVNLSYNRVT